MKIAIYARKSIMVQQSESIENQISLCEKYCKDNLSYNSITIYSDEGYSGKNISRPSFQRLLNDIYSKNIDLVLVYRLDRISRNTKDFYEILDIFDTYNVKFISITENLDLKSSSGKFMAGMQALFSQFERESISQRVRDNMYESAKKGSWQGGPAPFGYKFNRFYENNKIVCHLVEDEEKCEMVKLLYAKFLQLKSLTKLEKYTTEHCITGARGNLFNITSISKILRNPCYVKSSQEVINYLKEQNMDVIGKEDSIHGFLTYAKNSISMKPLAIVGNHNGLIDGDKWIEVQRLLTKNSRIFPRQGTGKKALLSGLLKCKQCGSNMNISYKVKNSHGKQLTYYVCSLKKRKGSKACSCSNLKGDFIDDLVSNCINNFDLNILLELVKSNYTLCDYEYTELKEIRSLEQQLELKLKNLDNLTTALSKVNDDYSSNSIIKKMNLISSEISKLELNLSKLKSKENKVNSKTLQDINFYLNNFKEFLNNQPLESKMDLLSCIIEKIEWDSEKEELNIIYK